MAAALYLPTLRFDLVRLDDHVMVIEDHELNRDPARLWLAFGENWFDKYYRPLHRVSFVLDAWRGGTDLAVYHRTNLAFHAVGSALVFAALLTLGVAQGRALFLGLAFAVHPALTSVVAWIPGRDNALVTAFLLASLIGLARYLDAAGSRRGAGFLALHWLAFASALLTKEAAVSFPGVALAYVALWRREPLRSRRLAVPALGWGAALLGFLVARAAALPNGEGLGAFGLDALLQSWPGAFAVVGKAVLPIRLSAFSNHEAVSVATGVVVVAGVTALAARSSRVDGLRVLFGAAWLGILIAPTLLQRTGLYDYGEYRIYWLLFGPLLIVAELLRALAPAGRRPVWLAVGALVLVAFAGRTLAYQRVFAGELAFWTQMVETYPESAWGWFHVGRAHLTREQHDTALAAYERAAGLGFANVDLYNDLAAVQLARDEPAAAAAAAAEAVALEPLHPYAHFNLGVARLRLRDYPGALEAFDAALDPRSRDHFAYARESEPVFASRVEERRGVCLYAEGRSDEAATAWTRAIALDPTRYSAYLKLIDLHLDRHDPARARALAADLTRQGGRLPPHLRRRLP